MVLKEHWNHLTDFTIYQFVANSLQVIKNEALEI
jgi:hypothetical protein